MLALGIASEMRWYYKSGGLENGPVSDAQLEELFRTGKIDPNTPFRAEGTPVWQALAAVRPDLSPRPPLLPAGTACVECGRVFPPDELVNLNHSWVCAQCKPVFLQRMAEGVPTVGAAGLWRRGNRLITRSETPFPDRCIKCNGAANGYRLKRVLYWHHPAYYLLLLCNLIVLIIVVLIVRKKAILHIGICELHRSQRRLAITACVVGMLGGVALIILGAVNAIGWLAVLGAVLFFTGIIWGMAKGQTIAAAKIEKDVVTVSGVGRVFLDTLPEWPN